MMKYNSYTRIDKLNRASAAPSSERTSSGPLIVAATAGKDQVRFVSLGLVRRMRLEVFDQAGDRIYDSDFRDGSLIDWNMEDQVGRPPDGLYGCMVTVEDLSGHSRYRRAIFWARDGALFFEERIRKGVEAAVGVEGQESVTFLVGDEALPLTQVAHDGKIGLVVSGRGGLSFRTGDLLAGKDVEQMRLTADGRLGLGVEDPAAKLDVAGLIRTSEGIEFPDGTIQRSAAEPRVVTTIAAGTLPNSVPSAADPVGPGVSSITRGAFTMSSRPSQPERAEKRMAAGGGMGRVNGTEGTSNTFYGLNAGLSNTTGTYNSFLGSDAGYSNTTGTYNSFIGYNAGYSNTEGNVNSFFGSYAGSRNTTGTNNSFFGVEAGFSNTTGEINSFFGSNAGSHNDTGNANSFFGGGAGGLNTTGNANSFFGNETGNSDFTGESNSFFGKSVGFYNVTGSSNSFFGSFAGYSNTVEHDNTFLGAFSNGAAGITNATALGYQAQVTQSNSLVLGSISGVNFATSDTNVGIGTSNPDRLLVLEGAQALARFTRFNETGNSFAPGYLCERARGTRAAPLDILVGDHLGKMQFRG